MKFNIAGGPAHLWYWTNIILVVARPGGAYLIPGDSRWDESPDDQVIAHGAATLVQRDYGWADGAGVGPSSQNGSQSRRVLSMDVVWTVARWHCRLSGCFDKLRFLRNTPSANDAGLQTETLLHKAERQYLLTGNVSRYCLSAYTV